MTSHGPAKHINANLEIIWEEVHRLAPGLVSLASGSPEDGCHAKVLQALVDISSNPDKDPHLQQYTLLDGHPRLINAVAKLYSTFYDRPLDPGREILITSGASYGIQCTIFGLLNPGDEVIVMEPFYEMFASVVEQARGIPVFVPLRNKRRGDGVSSSADWCLDPEELESKITSRTKVIIVNNPHNPLGKVFTRSELEMIGNLAIKHDIIVLMDEVYEFLLYDDNKHTKMATLPGMWERTITLGSAGKVFSITGWRIGWAIGPSHLLKCLKLVHYQSVRTCPTNLQEAIAVGLEYEIPLLGTEDSYWRRLNKSLQIKRNRLVEFLFSVGIEADTPQGSYFIVADYTKLASRVEVTEAGKTPDLRFFRWLAKAKGLLCVPMSPFYSPENQHLGENYIRFCFIKKYSTLAKAEEIISNLKESCF